MDPNKHALSPFDPGESMSVAKLIAPTFGLAVGIVASVLVGVFTELSETAPYVGRQIVVVVFFAVGLVMARRNSRFAIDLKVAVLTCTWFVATQIILTIGAVVWIDSDFSRQTGDLVDAVYRSVGWYPQGSDASFSVAIVLWLGSIVLLGFAAAVVASFIRAALRRKD